MRNSVSSLPIKERLEPKVPHIHLPPYFLDHQSKEQKLDTGDMKRQAIPCGDVWSQIYTSIYKRTQQVVHVHLDLKMYGKSISSVSQIFHVLYSIGNLRYFMFPSIVISSCLLDSKSSYILFFCACSFPLFVLSGRLFSIIR